MGETSFGSPAMNPHLKNVIYNIVTAYFIFVIKNNLKKKKLL